MPLVRIDTKKNSDPQHIQKVGQIVYQAMREAISVPDHDRT
jgi:hypothetical protein